MLLLLASLVMLFSTLGIWQLQRLVWKRELMATVDTRLQAEVVPIPVPADWAQLDVENLVYQRVHLAGTFDHSAEVQSLAVSELGSGYWVMTPMQLDGGGTVMVNRGFVPQSMREPTKRQVLPPRGKVVVTGLLRQSEPEGGFLRDNDPDAGRWYSRDIAAMAQAQRIPGPVAPFFVDAFTSEVASDTVETNPGSDTDSDTESTSIVDVEYNHKTGAGNEEIVAGSHDGIPRGGLTVVHFRNTHLSYALTWFALASLSIVGIVVLLKETRGDSVSSRL
ncbi:MAG: SURF1 family protein [Granulosicoccus sp.]|nr:SURF1 family protein [Granulosicoccus sp.]